MNELQIKVIEFKLNNAFQIRNTCININLLLISGIIGLVLSEFNYIKLILITAGILITIFISIMAYTADEDIDLLIKEAEQ